jgi:hypothetical protein
MTKKILTISLMTALFFTSCIEGTKKENAENLDTNTVETTQKRTDIPFTLAKNYFVLNTVGTLDNPKIENSENFNKIFGMATTMGADGKPTDIDFKTQFVIGVILPETNVMTTIEPVSLQKNDEGEILFTYKKVVAEKLSGTIRPSIQVIVNKSENGLVKLKEI